MKRTKSQIQGDVLDSLRKGDYDRLDGVLSNLESIGQNEAAFQAFILAGFEGYASYTNMLLKVIPKAENNPIVQFHILHEMLLHAMFSDMDGYRKELQNLPLKQISASIVEAHKALSDSPPSFSNQNYLAARELFTTYFENYKKMFTMLHRVSKSLDDDDMDRFPKWNRFPSGETSRFSGFMPNPNDTLIRNAISHKWIRKLDDSRIEVEDKVARIRKVMRATYMDKRLAWLVLRVRIVNSVLNLSGVTSNGMFLAALRAEKVRRRKESMKP
ncbi:MAG: hypothetical protein KKE24_05865 [Candidatus Thermoplasmatota archaeon]|nr:hypothetical protein [Candidatus Thermoplasmatota archaeon]